MESAELQELLMKVLSMYGPNLANLTGEMGADGQGLTQLLTKLQTGQVTQDLNLGGLGVPQDGWGRGGNQQAQRGKNQKGFDSSSQPFKPSFQQASTSPA